MLLSRRGVLLGAAAAAGLAGQDNLPDISSVPPDLELPPLAAGEPAPGRRVRESLPEWNGTGVHHVLYLPRDWSPERQYPVIVEYAGNGNFSNRFGDVSTGEVEGSKLGYGISGGEGFLWIAMPYVDPRAKRNQIIWWGDPEATASYCRRAVRYVCERYRGDPSAVIFAGFSRGAIAGNYIGLREDAIADIWLAFILYSHYDGVMTNWPYPDARGTPALARLKRLAGRAQFVCHEGSVEATRLYLQAAKAQGAFTFETIRFRNHNDAWTLRDTPERRHLRQWLAQVLAARPGTHAISGIARDGNAASPDALIESGAHWTNADEHGRYRLRSLSGPRRTVIISKNGRRLASYEVRLEGRDAVLG